MRRCTSSLLCIDFTKLRLVTSVWIDALAAPPSDVYEFDPPMPGIPEETVLALSSTIFVVSERSSSSCLP
jgi:hypothetical protein